MEKLLELRREYLEEVAARGAGPGLESSRDREAREEESKRPRKAR
jgi:hypothetical protein